VSTKIKTQQKVNDTQIFVDEVETQLREKPLRGSQTQEFHYSEDTTRTLPNQVHLPEGVFNGTPYLRADL
jgi:hypothetical protein